MLKWYINGTEMSSKGIFIATGYSVTSAPINRTVYSGGCASYVATKAKIGLKKLKLPLRIIQDTTEKADSTRSWALSLCFGSEVDIALPNGNRYVAAMTNAGETTKLDEGVLEFTVEFTGYQRGEKVSAQTPDVMCFSTVPETPYKITGTVPAAGDFTMAGVTFTKCDVGDVICIDGMAGKLTKNGDAVLIADTDFVSFPVLSPGHNTVNCTANATVEYYPIFM